MPHVKIDKGPAEVMRALLSGDPEQVREALEFQRESFRAKVGCYPEELVEVPHGQCEDKCEICDLWDGSVG